MAGRLGGGVAAAMLLMAVAPARAQEDAAPPTLPAPAIDYSLGSSWLCRPDATADACDANVDALAVYPAGTRTPVGHRAAAQPPVDCFYVYPTVSSDPTMFSDMVPDQPERRVAAGQAGRLSARCRVYAPMYRQLTGAGLAWRMKHRNGAIDFDAPYQDVRAAWASYLRHDNGGRGVVLVGHSQGAIILKRLLAEEIDGRPAQNLLVAAYLAGNPDLTRTSFRRLRPCASTQEAGCIVAWSTYAEEYAGGRVFGAGAGALCVNPAAPGGGRGMLKPYLPRAGDAPESDPPFVAPVAMLSAACVADGAGSVLRVRVEPGPGADRVRQSLTAARAGPTWGLHPIDVSLVQGNMLDLIGQQSAAWLRRR